MAQNATIYRAQLELSHVDRDVYADKQLTLARHPSETIERILMRLIVFALRGDRCARTRTRDHLLRAWHRGHAVARPILGIFLCTLLGGFAANAQDLEPRAYSNVPVGLNFGIVGYGYTEGGVSTDPALPIDEAEIEQHTTFLAFSHSFELLGQLAKVDVIAPYSWLSGSARLAGKKMERDVNGLGDPRLRLTWNFHGAPALSLEEWMRRTEDLVIGASVQVIAPLGQYDDERAVNLGNNRWTVKPEIGISKSWGPVSLELSSAVSLYQDNRDFLGTTREQDPLYAFQAHVVYSFRRPIWVALDGTYYRGGRTRVGGVRNDDLQSSTRFGLTFAFPISARQSLKLYGSTGVSTRIGGDWDAVGVAWQVRWGAEQSRSAAYENRSNSTSSTRPSRKNPL